MIKYAVLLTDKILAIIPTNQPFPEELLLNLDKVKVFCQLDGAKAFIASKLTFDDIWEFSALEGVVPGKIYYRYNI